MTSKIIYPNGQGGVSILHPTGALPIEEVARKDVPAGIPYLIIEEADIPTDRTHRIAWEADFSEPHGHGASYGVGTLWAVVAYNNEGRAITVRHIETGEVKNVEDIQ